METTRMGLYRVLGALGLRGFLPSSLSGSSSSEDGVGRLSAQELSEQTLPVVPR